MSWNVRVYDKNGQMTVTKPYMRITTCICIQCGEDWEENRCGCYVRCEGKCGYYTTRDRRCIGENYGYWCDTCYKDLFPPEEKEPECV